MAAVSEAIGLTPTKRTVARIRESHEGERLNVLGARIVVKSDGDPRHMTFCDHPVPKGYSIPPHVHDDEDEIAYVLEGEIEFTSFAAAIGVRCPARTVCLGPGGFVHLPRGVPHSWRNAADGPSRILVITSPGARLHRMFRELDAAMTVARGPHEIDIGAITARHDVRLI
jgi:quercetin dioxygenase-like cupin family protein